MRVAFPVALMLCLVTGCANHPLVDDVTGYTTHDIVQKLRCEAQAAIFDQIRAKKLEAYHDVALDLSRGMTKYRELRANYNTLFGKIDKVNDQNLLASNLNKKQREELGRAAKKLERERKQLEERVQRKPPDPDLDEKTKASLLIRIATLREREAVLIGKILALNEELIAINKVIEEKEEEHDDLLRSLGITHKRYLAVKKGADILDKATSAAVPEAESLQTLFSADEPAELTSIRELLAIIRTTLAMKLDFKITENNNATLDGSLTWPITLGSVSLGYKAGQERARVAQRIVQITSTFQELTDEKLLDCTGNGSSAMNGRPQTYPITGNVGIGELIKQYFKILDSTIVIATGQDTFTDNLAFTTKILGKLNPTIEIKPVHPSLVKAGLDLNADRTDLHQVAVQVRPYSPPSPPGDPKLHITKIPSVTVNITEGADGSGSLIGVQ